jgi:uncharacterized membrane protein
VSDSFLPRHSNLWPILDVVGHGYSLVCSITVIALTMFAPLSVTTSGIFSSGMSHASNVQSITSPVCGC